MNLGFLGTGHIASSVIEGIFKSKLKIKRIFISPRNKTIAKKLNKRFKKISISKNNQQLIDNSNWVFLSITPKVGHEILKNLSIGLSDVRAKKTHTTSEVKNRLKNIRKDRDAGNLV